MTHKLLDHLALRVWRVEVDEENHEGGGQSIEFIMYGEPLPSEDAICDAHRYVRGDDAVFLRVVSVQRDDLLPMLAPFSGAKR